VSADADEPSLSPAGDAVLYQSEGTALVRPLIRVERALFDVMRAAADRQVITANLKQVGLGLMMYAKDHDETFPPAGSDVQGLLNRYIPISSVFEGFIYTFSGGKMADLKDPANTPLGEAPAAGGRVVVYADGHVVFKKD
jgi:hypothetical protein